MFVPRVEVALMLVTCSIEQGAGQTQTIGSIDGTARLREFVATAREKGLRVTTTAGPIFVDSLRTAIACVVSLLVARLFRLPEAYWAPITTVVMTQSSLGAALAVSWHRFLGTVLGALVGAAMATYVGPRAVAFGIGLFVLGLIRIVTHSDLTGYRFGGFALRNWRRPDVLDGVAGEGSEPHPGAREDWPRGRTIRLR
jgi:uncharacterized membrane protein YccC